MSLLHEIQEAIIDPNSELAPILLKLRLLADRLGSGQLEEWVKYESEGYPPGVEVPEFRQVGVSYTGNFNNSVWTMDRHPIPTYLIEEHCGEAWTKYKVRDSIAVVEDLLRSSNESRAIGIDASNLVLMLQGKILEGMSCSSVSGRISSTAFREIQNTVRTRILELTMKLEKEVPGAAEITIGNPLKAEAGTAEKVEQVVHMTVNGTNTMITNAGAQAKITVKNAQGDVSGMVNQLTKAGVPETVAKEFLQIIASEEPEGTETPFGKKASEWLGNALPQVAKGGWNISLSIAANLFEAAAKQYYGLE